MSLPSTRRFLFLLGSTRRHGNSELLARHAAQFMPADVEQQWMVLTDLDLPHFEDRRHGDGYTAPTGTAATLLDATLWATDIVLVTPLYWYTFSVPIKEYLDYWSAWLRLPTVDFKSRMRGKTLWAIVASSGSMQEAQPLRDVMTLSATYMGMSLGGFLLGNGSRPGDVLQDKVALEAAEALFSLAMTKAS